MQVTRPAPSRRRPPIGLVPVAIALLGLACGAADASLTQPTGVQPSTPPPAPSGTWSTLAPMLQPRSEMAVAEVGGKVYVIGGYPPGRIPSNVVQVYDLASDSWTLGPPTPVPLHHSHAVAVGGRLFLIGGEFDGAGTGRPEVYLNTVYELDLAAGAWRPRAPMPTARSGGGVGVIDGKIYVAGGRPPRGNDFAVYDPAADQWTVLPALPTARNHLAVDAIGGRLYVAGGRFDAGVGGPMTAVLEIFDPTAGAWLPGAPLPAPRAGATAIAAFGCLYVIAGEGNNADPMGMFHQTDAYDPRTNTWHSLSHMPTATHGLTRAAFLDGRIHIPGGSSAIGGNNGTTLHQVYRPERRCDQ
jgi:N-acetylneuraminic acid mutarotase